jgi:hypothetical protein
LLVEAFALRRTDELAADRDEDVALRHGVPHIGGDVSEYRAAVVADYSSVEDRVHPGSRRDGEGRRGFKAA